MSQASWFFWRLAALLGSHRWMGYAPSSCLASRQNSCAIFRPLFPYKPQEIRFSEGASADQSRPGY